MHLDKCGTGDVNNPQSFAPRSRRPETPLQGNAVPHADPHRLTKLSSTSVELSRNGCPLPSVSMFCKDLLASESKSALCLSVVEDLCSQPNDRGSAECGELDKVGCMNPFKAYLVSKEDAERTKRVERRVASQQEKGERSTAAGGSGGFVEGGPMMVLHTMCSTDQGGTSLYGTELTSLSLETTLRTSSPLSDEAGGGCLRETSSDTVRTVPYSMIEVSTPESTPVGFGCAEASFKATFNTSRDAGNDFPSTASREFDRGEREEHIAGCEDVSILTGESRSLLDTLLSYSPRPGEIYSQEHPPPAPATFGGCSVMGDTRKSMMSSHPCPEGSELDFGWTFGKSLQIPNTTTMGSTTVEEAWENFFPPSGTITSTKTCLTSWEYYFGSEKPKANSADQPGFRPPLAVSTLSAAHCHDELSSLEYSDLASYSPRQKAVLGWAKPEIEEDLDEDEFGDEAPSPRQYQHSLGEPSTHPAHLTLGPPMHLIPNDMVKPSVGERVVTGVFTSAAHSIETESTPECRIVTNREGATSWQRGPPSPPSSPPNEVTDRSRQRFSVFLETGYPHVTAFNPFEPVEAIQPAVQPPLAPPPPPPRSAGKPRKRSIWSMVSHLFTCFHEGGEPMSGFENRARVLGDVSELPDGYEDYRKRSGLLVPTQKPTTSAAASGSSRSFFGRPKRRWWSLDSRPPSRGSTTYIPAAGPNGSHRRLKTFTGESTVSDGLVETPGTTGTPGGSSDYRYSQRHRFLTEKIEQERFNMEPAVSKA
ncbi:hypothetical protein BSKO_13315 [Bryopsis sp. KO-2023]|nr:hypothetical protein BSKO_13315 [Bryopsis sp. KO-2023]